MLEARPLLKPRKRQIEDCASLQSSEQKPFKRQKYLRNKKSYHRPEFWDNLSKIDLTSDALEELDRRNLKSVHPQTRPPITRLPKKSQLVTPAVKYLHECNTSILKDLKRVSRQGGPDMSELRGRSELSNPLIRAKNPHRSVSRIPRQSSKAASSSQQSTNTSNTRSTGPYNRNFQQNLIDGGVLPDGYEYPDGQIPTLPSNWEEINQKLRRSRRSLSPTTFTDADFRNFKRADAHAFKEKQVTTSVIPIIEGHIKDARCVAGGIPLNNLDHLTDGTIVPGNPDIYYGARPEQLDRQVRDELSGHIVPSTQDDLPICPNFFLAAKGPDGSLAVATRQACYDGALGARAMHSIRTHQQTRPASEDGAFSITSIYHGGTLKMYTSHCTDTGNSESRPEYHMHQLRSFAMADTAETFRQGAAFYRNARDWAEDQRNEAIRRANEIARTLSTEETTVTSSFISETITVENIGQSNNSDAENHSSIGPDATSNTTINSESDSCLEEQELYLDNAKRSNEHISPVQKKRPRACHSHDISLLEPVERAASNPSGLSQQFQDQVLDQGAYASSGSSDVHVLSRSNRSTKNAKS
ncbi:hypothetical protein LTR70_010554 [Exophiala xenobiotica]|uniref:DUF7924 domain-containing protein n=1 Tax=Lithohypha guttulata TaxID=1690604 RepID=A0ABR0JV80_9EURO|nr:hypothetical protein LTR24_010531 [Lithohypha guttulata]KAK5309157.1 hypothetical protein LTR70_010554 [Exophiala xenobiotica]